MKYILLSFSLLLAGCNGHESTEVYGADSGNLSPVNVGVESGVSDHDSVQNSGDAAISSGNDNDDSQLGYGHPAGIAGGVIPDIAGDLDNNGLAIVSIPTVTAYYSVYETWELNAECSGRCAPLPYTVMDVEVRWLAVDAALGYTLYKNGTHYETTALLDPSRSEFSHVYQFKTPGVLDSTGESIMSNIRDQSSWAVEAWDQQGNSSGLSDVARWFLAFLERQ